MPNLITLPLSVFVKLLKQMPSANNGNLTPRYDKKSERKNNVT